MVRHLLILLLWGVALGGAQAELGEEAREGQLRKKGGEAGLKPELRFRLLELLQLPVEERENTLMKWPRYRQMTPEQRAKIGLQLKELEQRQRDLALRQAGDFGISLTPQNQENFIRLYLQQRTLEEKKLWEEIKPLREQMQQRLREKMLQEFPK
jgi:hypothetical protein